MYPTFAGLYDLAFGWDPEFEFRTVDALLMAQGTSRLDVAVDAGAGTGRFIPCLRRRFRRTYAVEPDADMFAVLQTKHEGTEGPGELVLARAAMESFSMALPADAVVAMTDTLSYVLPDERCSRFVANVAAVLRPGGAFLVDAGMWSGYAGESRAEHWTSEVADGWFVRAAFEATISSQSVPGQCPRKVETLLFEANRPSVSIVRSSRQETLAFTHTWLLDMLGAHGLAFRGAAEPGKVEVHTSPLPTAKRLFYSFVKT